MPEPFTLALRRAVRELMLRCHGIRSLETMDLYAPIRPEFSMLSRWENDRDNNIRKVLLIMDRFRGYGVHVRELLSIKTAFERAWPARGTGDLSDADEGAQFLFILEVAKVWSASMAAEVETTLCPLQVAFLDRAAFDRSARA